MNEREIFLQYLGLPSQAPLGIDVEHADGIYLYSHSGKRYIDLVSGVSVSNVGHIHPSVVEAVREQSGKYMHLMVYGEVIQSPQVQLAKLLADLLPEKLNSVYFVNSGSEAIEGAMKLAKRHTGRTEVVAFRNAYHGGTQGALSILGNERLKNAFRPLLPDIRFLDFNDMGQLSSITEATACVFLECIQAEAGIILPEKDFLKKLRDRCTETGTLLIIDDIQMGMGRTGKMFSFEHYGIEPDILCLAKALGGGMPLGAFIAPKTIMQNLTFNPVLGHITTFGGHPVSCAAALASMKIILEKSLPENGESMGGVFEKLLSVHPAIKEIRRKGLMLGVEINDAAKMDMLLERFLEKGLIVDRFLFNETSFRIAPPLIITEKEVDEVCGVVLECLE